MHSHALHALPPADSDDAFIDIVYMNAIYMKFITNNDSILQFIRMPIYRTRLSFSDIDCFKDAFLYIAI